MPAFQANWKVRESDGKSVKNRLLGEGTEIREAESSLELKQELDLSLRKIWASRRNELIREYEIVVTQLN